MRTLLRVDFSVASFCVSSSARELSPDDQTAAEAAVKTIRPEAFAAHASRNGSRFRNQFRFFLSSGASPGVTALLDV
jgi:hypothetical protein